MKKAQCWRTVQRVEYCSTVAQNVSSLVENFSTVYVCGPVTQTVPRHSVQNQTLAMVVHGPRPDFSHFGTENSTKLHSVF